MNESFTIGLSEQPSPEEIQIIEKGLTDSISEGVEPRNYKPLAVFLKDPDGKIVGGLEGSTCWGWLNIRLLWVSDDLRGSGYGRKLVEEAEKCAASRGCCGAVVDTFSFQAREFYEALGYETFGVLDNFPIGHQRFYMKKSKLV